MSGISYISLPHQDILLALAWAAPMTTEQLHRLTAPHIGLRAFQTRLAHLAGFEQQPITKRQKRKPKDRTAAPGEPGLEVIKQPDETPIEANQSEEQHKADRVYKARQALIEGQLYYRIRKHQPPQRVGIIWALSDRGWNALAEHQQEPERRPSMVASLFEHDVIVSEVLVQLVRQAQPILSGMYVEREVRIDEARRRPRCDAILIPRFEPKGPTPQTLPFLARPLAPEEYALGYAIEVDRDTEPLGIIRDKAVSYSSVWADSEYYARYKRFPIPFWIVPTQRRLESIMQVWTEAWPGGTWLICTDEGLRLNRIEEYNNGQRRQRTLLDDWDKWVIWKKKELAKQERAVA